MFERYSENARRVIFYAHYEACQTASPEITTEHLLLGLIREGPELFKALVPKLVPEEARREIEKHTKPGTTIPESRDLSLSQDAKEVLAHAAEEAGRLGLKHIGCEHLLLALGRAEATLAAQILLQHGFVIAKGRQAAARSVWIRSANTNAGRTDAHPSGSGWAASFVWKKQLCEPEDALKSLLDGCFWFYRGEGFDPSEFELVKGGWIYFRCAICSRNLYHPGAPGRSIGFTNGQDWLCDSCYGTFAAPADEADNE